MEESARLIQRLHDAGYRITSQRATICRVLAADRTHPSPARLYEQVAQLHPGVSRATVYNTLTVLRTLGELTEVGMGSEETHYEANREPHVNLICVECGRISDMEAAEVVDLSHRISAEHGLAMTAGHLNLYGRCSDCTSGAGQHS